MRLWSRHRRGLSLRCRCCLAVSALCHRWRGQAATRQYLPLQRVTGPFNEEAQRGRRITQQQEADRGGQGDAEHDEGAPCAAARLLSASVRHPARSCMRIRQRHWMRGVVWYGASGCSREPRLQQAAAAAAQKGGRQVSAARQGCRPRAAESIKTSHASDSQSQLTCQAGRSSSVNLPRARPRDNSRSIAGSDRKTDREDAGSAAKANGRHRVAGKARLK